MGSNNSRKAKLPLIPLPKDFVLLPGVTLRIPIANRPDVSNLLSSLLNRTSPVRRNGNAITVGCVPLSSPYLSKDGQQLLESGTESSESHEHEAVDPAQAKKDDLFTYGTAGKVIGIQRRAYAEPYLVVEGVRRFTIGRITKERPFLEAEVTLHDEPSKPSRPCFPICHLATDASGSCSPEQQRLRNPRSFPAAQAALAGTSYFAETFIPAIIIIIIKSIANRRAAV